MTNLEKRVAVIGFGHIGSVIAGVLAEQGYNVTGIDKNKNLLDEFSKGNSPISEPNLQNLVSRNIQNKSLAISTNFKDVNDCKVIIITVGTPLDENFNADLNNITECCEELNEYLCDGQLILVKSTIPPGVTKNVINKILCKNKEVEVAFSPERLAEGNAIQELKTLPIVVGGVTKKAGERGCAFWNEALGVKVINVLNSETAEMVKLANNAWIDLNIGLANDIARLADKLEFNIDVLEVIKAANSLKKGSNYVNILTPSSGVGGYCLTKDPWFLYSLGKEKNIELNTIKAGRKSNDIMPEYSSKIILDYLKEKNIKFETSKVAILGFSFKSGSGDIRYSPVIDFINNLKKSGIKNIQVFDPLVTISDKNKFDFYFSDSYEKILSDSNCIAYMAAHDEIKKIDLEKVVKKSKDSALIFDGRRYFSQNDIKYFLNNGMIYRGIGR